MGGRAPIYAPAAGTFAFRSELSLWSARRPHAAILGSRQKGKNRARKDRAMTLLLLIIILILLFGGGGGYYGYRRGYYRGGGHRLIWLIVVVLVLVILFGHSGVHV
jgi:polyferredoxin